MLKLKTSKPPFLYERDGYTALMLAAQKGHMEIVKLMIKIEASIIAIRRSARIGRGKRTSELIEATSK